MSFEEVARLFRAIAMVAGSLLLLAHAAAAQVLEPPSAIDAYERARAAQDVDRALALFASNATVHLESPSTRTFVGRDQIRSFLQTNILDGLPDLTSTRTVEGSRMVWSERARDLLAGPIDLTVEAVVDHGRIVSLVYRPGRLSGSQPAPDNPMVSPAGLVLVSVALFGLGLVSLTTVRSRRASGSALRGRLVPALSAWRTDAARR